MAPSTAPAPYAPATPGPIGHSFAAVVDRLMAAREAAGAEGPARPVAISLHHGEFGEVSVRFEQRADGLSVALASADPDFARAVQAATPASGSGDAGMSGNGQGNPQGSPSATFAGAGNGSSGQRGNPSPQPERPAGPAANQAATPARTATAEEPAAQRGIFA
jgi:Meckel syndrome type 1 protein